MRYPLDYLKKTVGGWLYLEDSLLIDVVMAGYVANLLNTDPLWLLIIAPPSHTKTELLRAFDGFDGAYFLSSLTPSTLVSGIKPKKGVPEPSLLPQLNGKTLFLKDFTTVLSMRSENQQEILAQLREVYDGQYSKVFGNGKAINWQGHVGLIGACTPVYDRHYGVIGSLGDRFILYRASGGSPEKMGLQAQRIVGKEVQMRKEIQHAVHRFAGQFRDRKDFHVETEDSVKRKIVALTSFVAMARCPVERGWNDGRVLYQPLPEGTPRLVKQLMQLGIGLALVKGKGEIDGGVYEVLKKVGTDLITTQRLAVLEHLWTEGSIESLNTTIKTKDIADAVNIPARTTVILLEDLMMTGCLNRQRSGHGETSPYLWQINIETTQLLTKSEVFEQKFSTSAPEAVAVAKGSI